MEDVFRLYITKGNTRPYSATFATEKGMRAYMAQEKLQAEDEGISIKFTGYDLDNKQII